MRVSKLDIQVALDISRPTFQRYIKHPNWPKGTPTGLKKSLEWDVNTLPEVIEMDSKTVHVRLQVMAHLKYKGVPMHQILGLDAPEPLEPVKAESPALTEDEAEELADRLARSSLSTRETAKKRAAACLEVTRLLSEGYRKTEAATKVAEEYGISLRNLHRMLKKVAGHEPRHFPLILVSNYKSTKSSSIPPAAWRYFKADWLRAEKPSIAASYRRTQEMAKTKGWTLPHVKSFERRIRKEFPPNVLLLAREGDKALERKMPHVKRDKSQRHALEIVNADGHILDLRVKLPSGKVGRPVLIAWEDVYSGKILSYRMAETANQHVVRMSFGDLLRDYGIPQHAYLDNGREFANKAMSGRSKNRLRFKKFDDEMMGLFAYIGCEVHWAKPYHGQSKHIERTWRTLIEGIAKHPDAAGAYTGNKPTNKPANYGARVLEWNDLLEIVDQAIIRHNAQEGRKGEGANGRSFNEIFEESIKEHPGHKLTKTDLHHWLLMAKKVKVDKETGTVAISGNKYWSKEFMGLHPYEGKHVVVRYDPDDPSKEVYVYTLDGTLICSAETYPAEYLDKEAAAKIGQHRESLKKATKAELDELLEPQESDDFQLPKLEAPAPPKTKIIAPNFTASKAQNQEKEEESGFNDFDRTMMIYRMVSQKNRRAL